MYFIICFDFVFNSSPGYLGYFQSYLIYMHLHLFSITEISLFCGHFLISFDFLLETWRTLKSSEEDLSNLWDPTGLHTHFIALDGALKMGLVSAK